MAEVCPDSPKTRADEIARVLLADMAAKTDLFERTPTPSGQLGRAFIQNGLPAVLDKLGTLLPISWADPAQPVKK